MSTTYVKQFKALASNASEFYELIGDCILVEKTVEDSDVREKTLAGGQKLYLADDRKHVVGSMKENRPIWVRVLAVGKGFYNDETKEDVPLNVNVGDIVLVSQMSTKWFSEFGEMQDYKPEWVGLTRESEIQLRFKGESGYNKAFEVLNAK